MAFNFTNPLALPAFLPAAAMVLFTYRKFKGRSFHGSIGPLVLRVLVILLLVLSLAGLEIRIPVDHTEILFVADLSDSTLSRQDELVAYLYMRFWFLLCTIHTGNNNNSYVINDISILSDLVFSKIDHNDSFKALAHVMQLLPN
jgi:hypothetical protein